MKSLLTTLFLTASLASFSQVKQNAIVIGGQLTAEVKDGLFSSYLSTGPTQIAIVAGQPFTSVYYQILSKGAVIRSGKFVKKSAGEFEVIYLGVNAADCRTIVSDKPLYVTSKARNNG